MPDPYRITYDGWGHRTGLRDTLPAVLFKVERDGSLFYFGFTITRDAAIGFRDDTDEQMEALLASVGLDELERRLRAGVLPPEEGDYVEVIFKSDRYDHLKAMAEREKRCLWQERPPRGWLCTATASGLPERTTATFCAGCQIPDERVICAQLVHPEVQAFPPREPDRREAVRAMCNAGNEPENGAKCRPGGLSCWERRLAVGAALPDPPADVARLAADEIDHFGLVYSDTYGSKVWTIPQARTMVVLTSECESGDDFAAKLAVLADLLGKLNPYAELSEKDRKGDDGKKVRPLVALRRLMERDHPEAAQAVERLRAIPRARQQFPQHSGAESLPAFRQLGVDFPASDWDLAWRQVLTAFWSSLQAIRVAIQSGAPPEGDAGESSAES